MKAPEPKAFEQAPAGSHSAICTRLIDLGTQQSEYKGQKKQLRKIMIGWELARKNKEGKPFQLSKFYTLSLADKANLRADVESWRGKQFTDQECREYDFRVLLGQTCLLTVVLNEKNRANVKSVSPLPEEMSPAMASSKPVYFSLQEYDENVFESLSDKIKDIIKQSPEWDSVNGFSAPVGAKAPETGDAQDDGDPF